MGSLGWTIGISGAVAALFVVIVPEWTAPNWDGIQLGNQPSSMIQFPHGQAPEPVSQDPPAPLPAAATGGQKASAVYKNVQVLGDLEQGQFMRLQEAITQWVAPQAGCAFCHAGNDYASDAKPQKVAARLMLSMTRHINADMQNHVAPSGVTCFTCHRGQPIPAETWFPSVPEPEKRFVATQEPYREAADTVRKFFPDAGWQEYYLGDEPISAQSVTALPSKTVAAQVEVKRIYEMMMQMADGMGVNCGFCHNSRAFMVWEQSTPARWIAHYAIEQVRDLNRNWLLKLGHQMPMARTLVGETHLPVLPANEAGTQTGNGFVVCATCHYAQPKPMGGANVIAAYPGLVGP